MRYESSRGHKIDGTKPSQTGTHSERENRQKTADKKVASKGHRRHAGRGTEETKIKIKIKMKKQTNTNKKTNKRQPHNTLLSRLRKKGSPISGGIQPRHEDKGKGSGCDTWRKKSTEEGKGDNISGGGKAVPQQHSGNHVLKHNIFCAVYLRLYSTLVYGMDKWERIRVHEYNRTAVINYPVCFETQQIFYREPQTSASYRGTSGLLWARFGYHSSSPSAIVRCVCTSRDSVLCAQVHLLTAARCFVLKVTWYMFLRILL